jgi:hypothetical protein
MNTTDLSCKGEENWSRALFAQTELLRACWKLQKKELLVPGEDTTQTIPICRLDALGALGPDRKRIHEGFKVTTKEDWCPYPAFWGHDAKEVRTIQLRTTLVAESWRYPVGRKTLASHA